MHAAIAGRSDARNKYIVSVPCGPIAVAPNKRRCTDFLPASCQGRARMHKLDNALGTDEFLDVISTIK